MKKVLVCIFIICFGLYSFGQQKKVDSLKKIFLHANTNKEKMISSSKIVEASFYSNRKEFIKFLDTLYTYSKEVGNDKYLGDYYRLKGVMYVTKSKFKDAYTSLEMAKNLYKKTSHNSGLVSLYLNFATLYKRQNKRDSAILYYKKTISYTKDSTDKKNIIKNHFAHYNIALTHHLSGENKIALKHLDTALIKIKNTNTRNYEASTLYLMGTIYGELGNKERAIEVLKQAIPIFLEYEEYEFFLASVNNMSNYLDIDEAIKNYKYVLKELQKSNNSFHLSGTVHNNMAQKYITKKDYVRARAYLDSAYTVAVSLKNKKQIAKALKIRGDIEFIDTKNISKAIEHYQSSLEIFKEIKLIKEQRIVYNKLQKSYARIRKYEQAYSNMAHYVILNDSIYKKENAKAIEDIKVKYQTEKNKRKLAEQEIKLQQQEIENSYLLITVIIIGIILIILPVIIVLYYRAKKRKDELKIQQVSRQNQSLEFKINNILLTNKKIASRFETSFEEDVIKKMGITTKMFEVWRLQAQGYIEKEIAEKLGLQLSGVESRKEGLYANLFQKTKIKNITKGTSVRLYYTELNNYYKRIEREIATINME